MVMMMPGMLLLMLLSSPSSSTPYHLDTEKSLPRYYAAKQHFPWTSTSSNWNTISRYYRTWKTAKTRKISGCGGRRRRRGRRKRLMMMVEKLLTCYCKKPEDWPWPMLTRKFACRCSVLHKKKGLEGEEEDAGQHSRLWQRREMGKRKWESEKGTRACVCLHRRQLSQSGDWWRASDGANAKKTHHFFCKNKKGLFLACFGSKGPTNFIYFLVIYVQQFFNKMFCQFDKWET